MRDGARTQNGCLSGSSPAPEYFLTLYLSVKNIFMKHLLIELAEKLKSEDKDKSKSLKTLQDANILDMNGEFTEQYSNLNKVFKNSTLQQ